MVPQYDTRRVNSAGLSSGQVCGEKSGRYSENLETGPLSPVRVFHGEQGLQYKGNQPYHEDWTNRG